jgi:hypothetical protein
MKVIEDLKAVIQPPATPTTLLSTNSAWDEVFDQLGTRLPLDFVHFQKVFGEGYFYSRTHKRSASLFVYGGIRRFNLRQSVPERLSALRAAKERRPESVPHPLYWEPNGLLPWGRTSNETDLCWSVRGDLPEHWRVVVLRVAAAASESYDVGMVEFLTGLISGKIQSALMPQGFPGAKGIAFAAWPHAG